MYGTVTKFMGTAFTGLGITHKYNPLIEMAKETVFLKCPPTTAISELLNETAMHYIRRGYNVDKLMSPTQRDETDAIFIKGLNVLYIQASHPIALEPSEIGGRHRVISFYDVYDEDQLSERNAEIVHHLSEVAIYSEKALLALNEAKKIHDRWEQLNIQRMDWKKHEQLIATLKNELFQSMKLNKKSEVTHRLAGSLTSAGAQDYIGQITNRIQKRMLIKGLAGTGKSTIMKTLGKEAERRGFDVLYGWCGLDPTGVDLIIFPELSICFIDATSPHEYERERDGDEIIDLAPLCRKDEEAEKKIQQLKNLYREKMLDALGYMQSYAQAERQVKLYMDQSIDEQLLQEKASTLIGNK